MGVYAGESIAKKVARIRLYQRTKQALLHRFGAAELKNVRALFLPGPNASEVGALKHILGLKPENVLGVDSDPEACRQLERRWPGVGVHHGDLFDKETRIKADKIRERYHFVHLDVMGNLSKKSEILYGMWSRFCALDGVLAVTFLRGRETPNDPDHLQFNRALSKWQTDRFRAAGGEARKLFKMLAPDPERAQSHLNALNAAALEGLFLSKLGSVDAAIEAMKTSTPEMMAQCVLDLNKEGSFTALACHAYRAEVSPMGVLATQRVTQRVLDSDSYAQLRYDLRRNTTSVIRKDAMLDLMAEAESLEKTYPREAVAEILDTTPGTLAAWRAHRTMGTYQE